MKIKIMLFIILIAIVLYQLTKPEFTLQNTYRSPDNKYVLELYIEKGFNPIMSLSSESEFAKAYVILKDNKGSILVKPNWIKPCWFIIEDFNLEWQLKQGKVYFTKFNYIDLENSRLDCY